MYRFSFLIGLVWLLSGCSSPSGKSRTQVSSIGQPSEVLVVMDQPTVGSPLRESVREMLECEVPGLNQKEAFFRVSRVPSSVFRGEMRKMHSLLFLKLDASLKACRVSKAEHVDAAPQVHVQVSGPSVASLQDYLSGHADEVRHILLDHQLKMMASSLKKSYSIQVYREMQRMGYTAFVPAEIQFVRRGKDFLWGSSCTAEKQLNFLFYSVKAEREVLEDVQPLVGLQDAVLQSNVKGTRSDQWMETVWEGGRPVVLRDEGKVGTTGKAGSPVILRGLWQMHNGAMGGPFVSYNWYDETEGCIVTAEGFIYSPGTEKRDLMRRMEAALQTISRCAKK